MSHATTRPRPIITTTHELGEAGSTVYSSRTKRACIRKAMRTITSIASQNTRTFIVQIEDA